MLRWTMFLLLTFEVVFIIIDSQGRYIAHIRQEQSTLHPAQKLALNTGASTTAQN